MSSNIFRPEAYLEPQKYVSVSAHKIHVLAQDYRSHQIMTTMQSKETHRQFYTNYSIIS